MFVDGMIARRGHVDGTKRGSGRVYKAGGVELSVQFLHSVVTVDTDCESACLGLIHVIGLVLTARQCCANC